MIKRYLPLCLIMAMACSGAGLAQKTSSRQTKPAADESVQITTESPKAPAVKMPSNPVLLANQMMLVFMERMKAGNFKEAREVAEEMIFAHDKYVDTASIEHKSFHSAMEQELYKLLEKRAGRNKKIVWVEQPVSDGFYLLSVLDFQEGKHEEALKNMSQAIFWNPVRSAFYTERGFMLIRKESGPDITMAKVAYLKALELADNIEDFASALRGMAYVLVERGQLDVAYACLVIAKGLEPGHQATEEEMAFIRSRVPGIGGTVDIKKARELMKAANIPFRFSSDHVQVLIQLADDMKAPEDKDKAILLLKKAQQMSPRNKEVERRLKALGSK